MKKFRGVLWGLVLITIGVIFSLKALNIADIDIFFEGWWTLFIIVPSIIGLLSDDDKTGPLIGLIVGVLLFLSERDIIDIEILWKLLVPTVLIIIGLSLIFKNMFNKDVSDRIHKINKNNVKGDVVAVFSGQDIVIDEEYKGSNLVAVFGGIDLDLRDAKIKEDIVISGVTVFGGIDILLPEDVKVEVKSVQIFGGVENKKKDNSKAKHTIYIESVCIFGGIELK